MKIMVNDQLINYADEGEGDVILMLHGWGANLQTFDHLAKILSQNYRVVRMDFPGFGGSPQPSNDWSIGDYADLVAAFLKKRGIDEVFAAIVHSFGGRVIIKAVGSDLLQPEKIVLVGSGGIKHSNSLRQRGYKLLAKTGKQITKLPGLSSVRQKLRRRLYESAGASDYLEAGTMQQIFLKTINEDVRELAANITQPALLLWGANDQETPLTDAKILHVRMKNSKLVVIPDAGHFAYLDQPEKVIAEINAFL